MRSAAPQDCRLVSVFRQLQTRFQEMVTDFESFLLLESDFQKKNPTQEHYKGFIFPKPPKLGNGCC